MGYSLLIHHLETAREQCDAGDTDAMAKEVLLRHRKLAILQVYFQPVVSQDPNYGLQVVHTLVQVSASHPPII
jgi:hypothetical protein